MFGGAISQAAQPAHGGFIFLGDALAQAGNLTMVLRCVHERVPSFSLLCARYSLVPHVSKRENPCWRVSCAVSSDETISCSPCLIAPSGPDTCSSRVVRITATSWSILKGLVR